MDDHFIDYDLARGLHIIAVMAWVAGLLMLPRLYAYMTGATPGGELEQTMLKAAKNLRLIILGPAMILAWAFGLFLLVAHLIGNLERPLPELLSSVPTWFWPKLLLVLVLSAYHGLLVGEGRRMAKGERRRSARFWKLSSELPFIIAIAVVLLATLKPWLALPS
jgi:putative membrane protein